MKDACLKERITAQLTRRVSGLGRFADFLWHHHTLAVIADLFGHRLANNLGNQLAPASTTCTCLISGQEGVGGALLPRYLPLNLFTALRGDLVKMPPKFTTRTITKESINDPPPGKHYSLPFVPSTPSSPSLTLEGLFELTRHPSRGLNSCPAFRTTEIK